MAPNDWLQDRNESWRRIRVGVTGLCGILLLIGLANAMLQQLGPAKVPVAPTVTGQVAKPADEKNEPMAELGLAPGAAAPSDDAPAKK